MAFQDISTSAAVLSREITLTRNFVSAIAAFFEKMGSNMAVNSSAQRRYDLVQALKAKTDAELATLHIRRDDIVHHVFKDLYYI